MLCACKVCVMCGLPSALCLGFSLCHVWILCVLCAGCSQCYVPALVNVTCKKRCGQYNYKEQPESIDVSLFFTISTWKKVPAAAITTS